MARAIPEDLSDEEGDDDDDEDAEEEADEEAESEDDMPLPGTDNEFSGKRGVMKWNWGEVYVWGGVSWSPGQPQNPRRDDDMTEEERRRKVWRFIAEQYPVAAKDGFFAGNRLSPKKACKRFKYLTHNLRIPESEALELLRVDATPLLVEPEGVANAFRTLKGIVSRPKALELVRRHPGLLVGGARRIKQGASLVTAVLVDLLFSGRLLPVLRDQNTPLAVKLAELELYVSLAEQFKPVIDLIQRRQDAMASASPRRR